MRAPRFGTLAAAAVTVALIPSGPVPPPPPPPIGAYAVVPELPGMGRAVDIAATTARRAALARRVGRGVVLIPAGHERDVETDYIQDNDFRQSNTFFYFTELETQDAWLLLAVEEEAAATNGKAEVAAEALAAAEAES